MSTRLELIELPAYKDEKHKTWYVKFRYKNWQGESKFSTKCGFKTRKDALNYEHEFKSNSQERINITVANLVEKYLDDRKIHVKYNTYAGISDTINHHILPYLGKLKLNELTPAIMRKWQNEISKKLLKSGTMKIINTRCSTLLNYAVKYYGLKQNPLKIIDSIGKVEFSVNFWELAEFKKFIKIVQKPLHKICFNLLFYSGMRAGELLALNAGDFDFISNKINITKTKIKRTNQIGTPKTLTSVRTIDMPVGIMKMVKDYIDSFDKVPTPLFKITDDSLLNAIHKYAKAANVKEIRLHDLRHSHASLLIHSGVQITTISKRLGHKSPKTTLEVYSHMYAETGEQVALILQNKLTE